MNPKEKIIINIPKDLEKDFHKLIRHKIIHYIVFPSIFFSLVLFNLVSIFANSYLHNYKSAVIDITLGIIPVFF